MRPKDAFPLLNAQMGNAFSVNKLRYWHIHHLDQAQHRLRDGAGSLLSGQE
jgi:hypothetical protein